MTASAVTAFAHQAIQRWDFGIDNPNKAAAMLALLILPLLVAALRARRGWVRWCCAMLAAGAGFCLVQTYSRGGFVALFAGAAVLVAGLRNDFRRFRRWVPILLAVAALSCVAVATGFAGRLARSTPSADASVGNRLAIWRSVPSMMVDAPGGWGRGNAGDAFMGWYQPLDRRERYRTLVNSHFTWLVELGWVGRFCYVSGLALLFAMGAVRLKVRGDPLPLAVLTSFSAAAFFSSVAEDWMVCAVPLATSVLAFKTFAVEATERMRCVASAAALLAGCLVLGAFAIIGTTFRLGDGTALRRSYDGSRIVVGRGEPSAWAVCDPAAMGGPAYGRLLRAFVQTAEGRGLACGVAFDLAAVPDDARRLALLGGASDCGPAALARFASLADVRVISPNRPDAWLAAPRPRHPSVHVFCGEFAPSCPEEDAEGLTVVAGAGGFIPDWPRLAFAPLSD